MEYRTLFCSPVEECRLGTNVWRLITATPVTHSSLDPWVSTVAPIELELASRFQLVRSTMRICIIEETCERVAVELD